MRTKFPEKFKTSLRLTELENSHDHVARGRDGSLALTGASPGPDPPPARLLRFPAVRERTGLSRSTVWRLERNGLFPRHRRISPNAVAWSEKEIIDWIQAKIGG